MTPSTRKDAALAAAGLGFTLAAYGICLWGAPFVLPASAVSAHGSLYAIAGLLGALVGFFSKPASDLLGFDKAPLHASAAPALFAFGAFALLASSWVANALSLLFAGACLGLSIALFLLFWLKRISLLAPKTMRISLVASLVVAASCNGVLLASPTGTTLLTSCAGLSVGLACTFACGMKSGKHNHSPHDLTAQPAAPDYRESFKALLVPLACACALYAITPTINYVALGDQTGWTDRFFIICLAQVTAALILSTLLRYLQKPPLMTLVYLGSTPVLTVALFLFPFMGQAYSRVLLVMSSCAFFVVTSLVMVDCIHVARRHKADPAVLYGFCAGLTFLVRYLCEQVMRSVNESGISQDMRMMAAAFFVIYLLGFVFFLVQTRRKELARHETAAHAEADNRSEQPWNWGKGSRELSCCAYIQSVAGLSEREMEVFQKLLRGRNVPAIAEELYLSQNTVRTHVKRIYRVLDVHSRKDLLRYFECMLDDFDT